MLTTTMVLWMMAVPALAHDAAECPPCDCAEQEQAMADDKRAEIQQALKAIRALEQNSDEPTPTPEEQTPAPEEPAPE